MKATAPLLELTGLTKKFGTFVANDHINLSVYPGEVHAVLGENGAGKSTLMNMIYGMYKPDAGTIRVKGNPVRICSPREALDQKIGMVHQHFMLVEVFSAIDNIFLMGREGPLARRDKQKTEATLTALQQKYHIDVDIHSPVGQLSIGMQQKVEILKLLYTGADVLIFDEPTAVLLPRECEDLFAIIEHLAAEGKGVIFISHKLDEVLHISHRITVLTRGRVTGEIPTAEADKATIVRMMVGEDVEPPKTHSGSAPGAELLRAENLFAKDDRGVTTLNGVSLCLRQGEIIGIAGVEGNGQMELAEVLAGVRRAVGGRIFLDGTEIAAHSAAPFIQKGVAYVPADRNHVGSVPKMPLYENWLLRSACPPRRGPLLDYTAVKKTAAKTLVDYDVRAWGIEEPAADLSGGNLQKFILARCLAGSPRVLICAYPTRGLDIKSSYFIREKLLEAKRRGVGTLLLSGDFEELFALSDRILILCRGQVAGEVVPEETTVDQVGMLMMGGKAYGACT